MPVVLKSGLGQEEYNNFYSFSKNNEFAMNIMSRPQNDLTLAEKQERVKNELESLYASANFGEIGDFTASESEDEENEVDKSEENLPPENLPAKTQRRNVMIKQSDYSRRKRPGGGASANKKTSSAWVTALSSSSSRISGNSSNSNINTIVESASEGTGSSRHIDHTGAVAQRVGRASESDKRQERNGVKPQSDNAIETHEETRQQNGMDNGDITIDMYEMELAEPPEVRKAPPRRTRSSELGSSTHSNGSSGKVAPRRTRSSELSDSAHSHGSSGRAPPRRRKSTTSEDSSDSNGSSGRVRLRRTRSGDLTKASNSTATSANSPTDQPRRRRPNNDSKSASSSSPEGDSSNGGTRRTRRGRRSGGGGPEQGSTAKNKSDGDSDNKLDDGDNNTDEDDGSIISNPDGISFAAMGDSANSAAGSSTTMSALQKLKAAAKIAAASDIGDDDEIPKSSTRSRNQSSHRGSSGKERLKVVATGLLFINKTKKLSEERRRSGSGRDRSDSRRRVDGGERRRQSGEHSRRRTEGDRRGRTGAKEASGDGRSKSSSSRSPSKSDDGEGSNTRSRRRTAQQDQGENKAGDDEENNSRRRIQTAVRSGVLESQQSSGVVVGEVGELKSIDTGDPKVASSTSSASSSRGRKTSKWSTIKGGLEFINKTKSLSKSNHRSRSLERKKNLDNDDNDDNDNQEQHPEKLCPPSPGLTRSNSDGSINVASLASPSGRMEMRAVETKEFPNARAAMLKSAISKSVSSLSSSIQESDNNSTKARAAMLKNSVSKSVASLSSIQESENNSTKPSTNLKGLLAKAVEQNTNEKKKTSKWNALKGGVDFANRLTSVVKAKKESGGNNSSSSDKKKSSSLEGKNGTDGTSSTDENGKKGNSMWGLASKLSTTTKKKKEAEVVMDYGLMMSVSSFSEDAMEGLEGLKDFNLPTSFTIEEGDEDEEEKSESEGEDDPKRPGPTTVTSQADEAGKLGPSVDTLFDLMDGGPTVTSQADEAGKLGPSVDTLFDLMDGGTGVTSKTQMDAFDLLEGRGGSANGKKQKNAFDLVNTSNNALDAFSLFGGSTDTAIKKPGVMDRRQLFSKVAEPSMRFDFDKTSEKVNNLSHPETIEEGDEEEDDVESNETPNIRGSSNLRGLMTMAMDHMDHMDAIEEEEEDEESENSESGIQVHPGGGIVINTGTNSKWSAVKNSIMFTSLLNANIADLEQQKENEESVSSSIGAADDCPNVDFGLMMSMEDFSADAMEGLDDLDVPEDGEDNQVEVIRSVNNYKNVAHENGSIERKDDIVVDRSQQQPAIIDSPDSMSDPQDTGFAPSTRIVTPEKPGATTTHNSNYNDEDELDDSSSLQEDDESPLSCVQLCIVPGRKGGARLPMAVHKLEEETNDGVRLMSVNGKQMSEKEIIKNGLFRLAIPKRKKTGKKERAIESKREADCRPKGPDQVFGWARTPSTRKIEACPMPKGRMQDPKLAFLRAPVLTEGDEEEEEDVVAEREEPVTVNKQNMVGKKQPDIMIKYERMHRALRESRARSSAAKCAIQTLQQEIQKQQSRLKELEGLRQASLHDLERKNVEVKRK